MTNVLAKDKDLLGKLIDIGALGATNYTHVYDPAPSRLTAASPRTTSSSTPAVFACSVLNAVNVNADQCLNILKGFGLDKVKIPTSAPSSPSLGGLLGVGK